MHRLQDARGDPRAADGLTSPSDADRAARTGRFAPSPTGDLHAGSLVAALASRCDAPRWRVRIDDIDPPRAVPGSAERIVAALREHGFPGADAPIERQSEHGTRYREALLELAAGRCLFACTCTRRELAGAPGCTGRCRRETLDPDVLEALLAPGASAAGASSADRPAVRATLGGVRTVEDRVLGPHRMDLDRIAPDVVVLRRDGLFSYHLATAVDDACGIDDVVRGADLFEASGVQAALMDRLGRRAPRYAHVPVALDERGEKLAKRSGAARLDPSRALDALHAAWRFLGQRPLGDGAPAEGLDRFWAEAPARWRLEDVPPVRTRPWGSPDGSDSAR